MMEEVAVIGVHRGRGSYGINLSAPQSHNRVSDKEMDEILGGSVGEEGSFRKRHGVRQIIYIYPYHTLGGP